MWEWSYCVFHIKTQRFICNMTYLGHHVTLTWGQILTSTFQGHNVYVSMRLGETNTMVPKSSLHHWKQRRYKRKKCFAKMRPFPAFMTSVGQMRDLNQTLKTGFARPFLSLSNESLNVLLLILVSEIIAKLLVYSPPIFEKKCPFWPLVTSSLTWLKNGLSIFFCRTRCRLSIAFSASLYVARFSRSSDAGEGAVIRLPVGSKLAQTPVSVRGLNMEQIMQYPSEHMEM